MQIISGESAIEEMQALGFRWRAEGRSSALAPTMGALHEGHLKLLHEGGRLGSPLVMSLFVNPSQFGPGEDLEAYPRDFEADCDAAKHAGVDVVFAPRPDEVYPEGFQTRVRVQRVSGPLEGERRPGHFGAVATVVMKLLNICQPSVAVFGWKDAQQFIMLRTMVRDLNLPVRMVGIETVREASGLAMSSRNRYLSAEERSAAHGLSRALFAIRDAFEAGQADAARLAELGLNELKASPLVQVDYLSIVDLETLAPTEQALAGATLVAVAARVGSTRLIDNVRL